MLIGVPHQATLWNTGTNLGLMEFKRNFASSRFANMRSGWMKPAKTSILEAKIIEALDEARRRGELETALALAMAYEALTRDRIAPNARNPWPAETPLRHRNPARAH